MTLSASLSLLSIWQWGAGAFALVGALVWLYAGRPLRYRTSIWLAAAILLWPLAVVAAILVLILIAVEAWHELRHDTFWKLP